MVWETFVESCRVGGRVYHFLWQSQLDFDGGADRLVGDGHGGIAAFASDSAARQYALSHGEQLSDRDVPPQFYDLDAVAAWCANPVGDTLDPMGVWRAWMMLEDAAVVTLPEAMPGEPGFEDTEIFDNVFFAALAAESGDTRTYPVRPWRESELARLGEIMGGAIAAFEGRLSLL